MRFSGRKKYKCVSLIAIVYLRFSVLKYSRILFRFHVRPSSGWPHLSTIPIHQSRISQSRICSVFFLPFFKYMFLGFSFFYFSWLFVGSFMCCRICFLLCIFVSFPVLIYFVSSCFLCFSCFLLFCSVAPFDLFFLQFMLKYFGCTYCKFN